MKKLDKDLKLRMSHYVLCILSIGGTACDGSEGENSTKALSMAAPQIYLNEAGTKFVRVKQAKINPTGINTQAVAKEFVGAGGEHIRQFPADTSEDLRAIPIEKLATLLRKRVLLRNGYEYLEAELPTELAAKVKKDLEMGTPAPQTKPFIPKSAPSATIDNNAVIVDGGFQRQILGSDNRIYVGGQTSFPNSTILFLGNCTASMIGSRVAVTAAHCIYSNGSWTYPSEITPAADTGTNPAPYGHLDWTSIEVASGWTGSNYNLDYAYITFASNTGLGWLGTADSDSGTMQMIGYPGDKPTPQMWAKSGVVTQTSAARRRHDLDTIGGDSGSGLYTQGDYRIVGIHSTENSHTICYCGWWCCSTSYWNEATRWTSTTHAFVASSGIWPD